MTTRFIKYDKYTTETQRFEASCMSQPSLFFSSLLTRSYFNAGMITNFAQFLLLTFCLAFIHYIFRTRPTSVSTVSAAVLVHFGIFDSWYLHCLQMELYLCLTITPKEQLDQNNVCELAIKTSLNY